jgi:two-component sensor histidine kinase
LVFVTIVLLLAAGLLVGWGLLRSAQRVQELGTITLDRVMDAQISRVTMLLNAVEQHLEEEAAYVKAHDTLTDAELLDRWRPVLLSQPAISTIGLADERGDESSLSLGDKGWTFTSTQDGSKHGPPLVTLWPAGGDPGRVTHIAERPIDPRESAWFSQALEERHGDPVWSTGPDLARGTEGLNASLLLRASAPGRPYRILRFTMEPALLMRSSRHNAQGYSTMQLSATGHPYIDLDTSGTGIVWRAVLEHWDRDKATTPFVLRVNDNDHIAQVLPRTLKGTEVLTAAVVDLAPMQSWIHLDRIGLLIGGGLLLTLSAVLLRAYILGRRTSEQVRKQERRSRSRERQLAKALNEREILDREVHHRVKNNLQVVSSLLNLQAQRIEDESARSEFLRGKRRIDSMALVHHKLYALKDLTSVDLRPFLTDLTKAVAVMFEPESRAVSHSIDTAGIRSDADTAIQVGLILCELITNCFQHAFPYATGGHIDVIVRHQEADLYRMVVKDNGKGLERGPLPSRAPQLGLEIVEALAEQLDGGATTSNGVGTSVEVLFRMRSTGLALSVTT